MDELLIYCARCFANYQVVRFSLGVSGIAKFRELQNMWRKDDHVSEKEKHDYLFFKAMSPVCNIQYCSDLDVVIKMSWLRS